MATIEEYAQLSTRVYMRTQKNRTPLARGWTEIQYIGNDSPSGFSAGVYQRGEEIVIAYTGTNESQIVDFASANIPAGLSIPSAQVTEAMLLYLETKRNHPQAQISFTGHSLGGGLASLMAVFFAQPATIFDPAPFEPTARNLATLGFYETEIVRRGYSDAAFDAYLQDVTGTLFSQRESRVSGYSLESEILEPLRTLSATIEGSPHTRVAIGEQTLLTQAQQTTLTQGALSGAASLLGAMVKLHSMTLLTEMLMSAKFETMVQSTPESLKLFFDESLYASDPQVSIKANFLDQLLITQMGDANAGIAAATVLDKFADDLAKLQGRAGVAQTKLTKELIVVAMEYYYLKQADFSNIFTAADGAISFKYSDIGASDYKSLPLLKTAVEGELSSVERQYVGNLLAPNAWHIQQGSAGVFWTASDATPENDLALGGVTDDYLDAGDGADILIGGGGSDVLNGGGGDDTLLGGRGFDTYVEKSGEGDDQIFDLDGKGQLIFAGSVLNGGTLTNSGIYQSGDGKFNFSLAGQTLTISQASGAAGTITINNFVDTPTYAPAYLGIRLTTTSPPPPPGMPLTPTWRPSPPPPNTPIKPIKDLFDQLFNALWPQSPIVLDLDGNGITTSMQNGDVHFDLDTNGYKEATGWISPGDGFLALDLNGDGEINSGRELFGNHTLLHDLAPSAPQTLAENGYRALALLDQNKDGKLDANDSAFNGVRVWQDVDGDGLSAANELHTLAELGIVSLATAYVESSLVDAQGNAVRQTSHLTLANGSLRETADVWFATNQADTEIARPVEISDEIAALPNLKGSGSVPDLHQAIARDASGSLRAILQQIVDDPNPQSRRARVPELIYAWTNSLSQSPPANWLAAPAMIALQKYFGATFRGTWFSPYFDAAQFATMVFGKFTDFIYAQLMGQIDTSGLYTKLTYSSASGEAILRPDFSAVTAEINSTLISDPLAGKAMLRDFVSILSSYTTLSDQDYWVFTNNFASRSAELAEIVDQASGKLVSVGSAGDDAIAAPTWQSVLLDGQAGNDTLTGGAANDILHGGDGNDRLLGDPNDDLSANDILDGGRGNDDLAGGGGSDVYVFRRGDGQDTITDHARAPADVDTLIFDGTISPTEVRVSRQDGDLQLQIGDTDDRVILKNIFDQSGSADSTAYRNKRVEFSDGSVWHIDTMVLQDRSVVGSDAAESLFGMFGADVIDGLGGDDKIHGDLGNDVLAGNAGNDTLFGDDGDDSLSGGVGYDDLRGGSGNDTLSGGSGNDYLDGDVGSNVYLFNQGDGSDSIVVRSSTDTILFGANIVPADVLVRGAPGVYLFSFAGSSDRLSVNVAGFGDSDIALRVQFANGAVWQIPELDALRMMPTMNNDALTGTAGNDVLEGLGGNDNLSALAGNDTLHGGAGSDTLVGGSGDDTYLFGRNEGSDVIIDAAGNDTVRLGADITPYDLKVTQSGNYLALGLRGSADSLVLSGALSNEQNRIETVAFSDGTIWTEAELEAAAAPRPVEGIYVRGSMNNDTITGAEKDDTLTGAAGSDQINGLSGADTLVGGAGDDLLWGGAGNDVYYFERDAGIDTIFESGGDDAIRFATGISPSDIAVTQYYLDLRLAISGSADRVSVTSWFAQDAYKIERVEFADGSSWSVADLMARLPTASAGDDQLFGSVGNDALNGLGGNDTLDGMVGDDTLEGGAGNDILYGGLGNDLLDGGTGDDFLQGDRGDDVYIFGRGDGVDTVSDYDATAGNIDTVRFASGISAADIRLTRNDSQGLELAIRETSDQLILRDWFVDRNSQIEQIAFVDGTVWQFADVITLLAPGSAGNDELTGSYDNNVLNGLGGNDTLNGLAGYDTLDGGAGNDLLFGGEDDDVLTGGTGDDYLSGGTGADTYLFNRGDGADDIVESTEVAGTTDTLLFGATIAPADILVTRDVSNNVTLAISGAAGTTDRVTLYGWLENLALNVKRVEFADGSAWRAADLLALSAATDGDDRLVGTPAGDILNGQGGNDLLSGLAGNDTLLGGAGNDTLDGGSGDDLMSGASGNDAYVVDSISDLVIENANEGLDQVQASVSYTLPANVEMLSLTGSANSNGSGNNGSNFIKGNAGANSLDGGAGVDILQAGAGADRLTDISGNGVLDGGAGNDTLISGTASDLILGGAGNDTLTLASGINVIGFNRGDGRDVLSSTVKADNVISLGKGITYANLAFSKQASDLILSTGANEQILFRNWYANPSIKFAKTLQMIIDGGTDYKPASSDPLKNRKVEVFDFAGLVATFDQARNAAPSLSTWALSSSLLRFHLSGSNTAAIGGDLATEYARAGNLSALSMTPAQSILGATQFGTAAQALQAPGSLQDLSARLM